MQDSLALVARWVGGMPLEDMPLLAAGMPTECVGTPCQTCVRAYSAQARLEGRLHPSYLVDST